MSVNTAILKTLVMFLTLLLTVIQPVITDETDTQRGRFLSSIVRLNPAQRFNIGMQITVPVSFFMPNWGTIGRQNRAMSLNEYKWSAAARQSKAIFANACPTETVALEDYLYMLQIDVEACQKRFICEIASDPKKFSPLSEIFLKKIAFIAKDHESRGGDTIYHQLHNATSDGWVEAARVGVNSRRQCHLVYEECPVAADTMVNMNYLWMWQMASHLTNIQFAGETENSIF